MSDPENSKSPQLKLIDEWDRGFKEKNLDYIAKGVHKDFRRCVHPRSLGIPDANKEQWLQNVAEILDSPTVPETTTHLVIEAPGKVILHSTTNLKTPSGADVERESIHIIHFVTDEDGSLKVKQSQEFTDSKSYFHPTRDAPPKGSTSSCSAAQTSDLGNSDSPQIQLVNEFRRGFEERNPDLLAKHLHKDFRRLLHPKSLKMPELNREEWLKGIAGALGYVTELETRRHSVTEAPGKVTIHSTTSLKTPAGRDVDRESIYIIHLTADEDGTLKIKQFEEFTDSTVYLDLFRAAAEARANSSLPVA